MTSEQKEAITAMRHQGIGYTTLAKSLGLPLNTVKTYCRRNNLSSIALFGKVPEKEHTQSRLSHDHAAKEEKTPTECEVVLSYRESPDMRAVADVMMTLMNIQMR